MNCPRCRKTYADDQAFCVFCGSKNPSAFPGMRYFYTKVAGVTHKNADRRSRQAIIRRIEKARSAGKLSYEKFGNGAVQLVLDNEPDNPADKNAIKVQTEGGEQIGYLQRELAADVAPRSAEGYKYLVLLDEVTGGYEGAETLGANILIVEAAPGESETTVKAFFSEYLAPKPMPKIKVADLPPGIALTDSRANVGGVPAKTSSGCLIAIVGIMLVTIAFFSLIIFA